MGDATKTIAGRNFKVWAAPYASTNVFPNQSPWGSDWSAGVSTTYVDKGYTVGNVRFSVGFARTDIRVDQLIDPVTRIATGRTITLNTALAQITAANLRDGTGNGTVTSFVATPTSITPPAAAPTLSTAGTGGTVLAGVYIVGFTWVNANGETTLSPTASITTSGTTSTITVTVPTLPSGATAAAVYVSQANGTALTRQGQTATTTFTLTAPPTTSGAAANTSNLTGTRSYDDLDFSSVIVDNYYTVGFDIQQFSNSEAIRVVAWKGLPTGTPAIAVAPNAPSSIAYDISALPDDSVSPSRILKVRFNQTPV